MTEDRRRYDRFKTEAEVYFQVAYDIRTKVRYQILDKSDHVAYRKYLAMGKNVSAQGIAFKSFKKLNLKDRLYLEVYLPGAKDPICMEGEVRWSEHLLNDEENTFNTGVKLSAVGEQNVDESIYLDPENNVTWSIVLESIFGSFKSFQKKIKEQKKSSEQ